MKRTAAQNNDAILKTLSENGKAANVCTISRETQIELYKVRHYLYLQRGKGFVNFLNNGRKLLQDSDFIELSSKGRFYLQDEGGFLKEFRNSQFKKIWLWTKIITTVLYSLAVLAVSIWAVKSSSQTSDHEKRLKTLEQVLKDTKKR